MKDKGGGKKGDTGEGKKRDNQRRRNMKDKHKERVILRVRSTDIDTDE
jgi:hypothetical protein